jgi:hypothetical protein
MPAVQAYLPDYLPGAATPGPAGAGRSQPSHPVGGTELAAQLTDERAQAGSIGAAGGGPTVEFIRTATSPRSRAAGPGRTKDRTLPAAPAGPVETTALAVVPAAAPVVPLLVTTAPSPAPAPLPAIDKASKPSKDKANEDTKAKSDSKPKKDSKERRDGKPRQDAKPDRKSETDKESKRSKESSSKESQTRKQPVSRERIVTA